MIAVLLLTVFVVKTTKAVAPMEMFVVEQTIIVVTMHKLAVNLVVVLILTVFVVKTCLVAPMEPNVNYNLIAAVAALGQIFCLF